MAVQTETYANILARVEALLGDSLTTTEKARFKALLNRRSRMIYKRFDHWPSFFIGKKARKVSGLSSISNVILDGDGTDPGYDQIDELFTAWQYEPFTSTDRLCPMSFYEQDDASVVPEYELTYPSADDVNSVTGGIDGITFLSSISSASTFGGTITIETSSAHGLVAGDRCYISGLTYSSAPDPNGIKVVAFGSSTSITLEQDTTFTGFESFGASTSYVFAPIIWASYRKRYVGNYGDGDGETSTVPHEWADYLVQACYADALRADGQTEKAAVEEIAAERVIEEEIWRQDRKLSKQDVITKIHTHSTKAYR